jgi:hypothetical protein
MPSSSTGNTLLERELIRLFRHVYTHLYISRAGAYLDFCTAGFANTLEMTPTAIQRAIRCDLVLCRDMVARSKVMAPSARLSEAEDACLEMSSLLTANHCAVEGAFWCSCAMFLWSKSAEAKERENQLVESQRPIHVLVVAQGIKDAQRQEDAQKREEELKDMNEKTRTQMREKLRMLVREHVEMLFEDYERSKRSVKAAGCERLMEAHECDQRLTSSSKLGKRPMELNRCEKRPREADESYERPMSANKRGKRALYMDKSDEMLMSANKRGKRPVKTDEREQRPPLEANKGVSRDQAVKEANIEQLEYIFACWRSQLDGRLDESSTHQRD